MHITKSQLLRFICRFGRKHSEPHEQLKSKNHHRDHLPRQNQGGDFNAVRFSLVGVILALSFVCSIGHASQVSASEVWMRIDHNGVVPSIPAKADSIPKWPGWTDKFEHVYQGDIPYRSKMNPDGSELRFSYDMWNTPGEDRFKVSSVSPQGVRREGFVDSTGQIVIPPKYTWVNHFYNGLTAVREKKGEPWLLLDKNGNLKYTLPKNLQPDINNIFRGVSKEGMLAVQEGDIEVMFGVGTDGLYDLSNQKFFPLGRSTVITQFSEGLCLFESGTPSLAGYADVSSNVVIPRQFDEASSFEDGLASVRLGKQRGLIDHTGHFVVKFSDRFIQIDPFHEGLAAVVANNAQGVPKLGFIDKTGKLVIPAIYNAKSSLGRFWAPRFSEGVAAVGVGDEVHRQYGFIDKQGNWKIQAKFREAYDFANGYAQVKTGPSGFNQVEWAGNINRGENFHLFIKQFGLLGMSRESIMDVLGKGDQRYIESDIYTLFSGACGNSYSAVEIYYDDDKVSKYRALGHNGHGKWIDHSAGEVTK